MYRDATTRLVPMPIRESSSSPTVMSAVPAIGKAR